MLSNRLAVCAFGVALCAMTAPKLAHAGDGTDLLKMVAADSQMVMVIDVADSRDSALVQKGWDTLLAAKPDAKAKMAEIGIDPLKDIDTVLFAGGGVKEMGDFDNAKSMVLIVEGRLPKDKLKTMPDAKSAKYQGVEIWTKDDTDAAFVGDRLFFTKKGKMKAAIDVALGKGKGKGNNVADSKKAAKLREAVAGADTTADAWLVVLVPDKDKKNMGKDGIVVNSVSGGASFTADLALQLRLNSDSEASAAKAVAQIQAALPQATQGMGQIGLTKAAKSLMVTQDKASVKMAITVTGAEIKSVMAMMGGAMGGGSPPPPPPPATKKTP